MSDTLKLKAETAADLGVLSAILQDAIVRVGDIHINKDAATVTVSASRYAHENDKGDSGARLKSGIRFNNILSMKGMGIDRSNPDAFIVLLSVSFNPGKPKPGGEIVLVFAGGGELRLQTEYLEARMIDVSAPRSTKSRPIHPLSE